MSKTGYYSHADCRRHEMGAGHPECPERLSAIEDRLLIRGLDAALERREAPTATFADLELAHGRRYLEELCSRAERLAETVRAGGPDHDALDPDTLLTAHTLNAALHAVGAALAAKYTSPQDQQYLPDHDPAFDVVYAVRPRSAMAWRLDDYAASQRRWTALS